MRLKYDVSVSQSKHSSALSSVIDPRHCLTLIASAVTYVPHVAVTKEFSYYLLLVDVGLRSFTIFECPTRCRHRDASWRSRLSASTTCDGSVFQCDTTLWLKKSFRMSSRDLYFLSLYLCPLVPKQLLSSRYKCSDLLTYWTKEYGTQCITVT